MKLRSAGFIMLLGLVFGAIFLGLVGALSGYVLVENKLQRTNASSEEAFSIAEAGVEAYKWFLAHYPGNTTYGTGHAGPYVSTYYDPENGTAGTISLSINGTTACGQTTSIKISSTGTPADDASVSKTVSATYAQPSVATYSYILNDSVWAGADRVILGPYHSNGGIRMDGTANSPVTSSVSSWTCTSSFGCSHNTTEPGVFGAGSPSNLWSYPTPQVDFSAIAADFSGLKSTAQTSGKYFTYGTKSSQQNGIHLIFNANGTVTVKKVTSVNSPSVDAFVDGSSGSTDYSLIKNETTLGTYTLASDCGLVFVENRAWIEGTITGKVTIVVADVTDANGAVDAIIPNNLTYSAYDGTVGLTVIAQHDVLIGPTSPSTMTMNGIFIAQNGAFGRNLYDCPGTYEGGNGSSRLNSLTILGTTVSNKRTGTKWINGCGFYGDAGYQNRTDSYDRTLASSPPPFTPAVSTDYELMDWHEN
ncbi:MAG TPA: hypothetical protein VHC20_07965 [Candidatus Paceibacterota bacterium]|nr:hypothetical protein [Candidatus Paceibacterota bacterium]